MLLPTRGQRVDQRPNRWGIITDEKPGGFLAGLRAGDRSSAFLPTEFVAVVFDGLGAAFLVVLCRKLGQHTQGLMVAGRTVE